MRCAEAVEELDRHLCGSFTCELSVSSPWQPAFSDAVPARRLAWSTCSATGTICTERPYFSYGNVNLARSRGSRWPSLTRMSFVSAQLQISFYHSLTARQGAQACVYAWPQHLDVHAVLNAVVSRAGLAKPRPQANYTLTPTTLTTKTLSTVVQFD